ncbi:MAG: hypothetical protein JWN34_3204 [Bryobacterales bacterium]|jgi:hypothetical protein|nr:hypothetical protein [Bryobacterales bacterium]
MTRPDRHALFTAEESALFQGELQQASELLKQSFEENERIQPERERLAGILFADDSAGSAPAQQPTPAPAVARPHPLEGLLWFRLAKVVYFLFCGVAGLICIGIAASGEAAVATFTMFGFIGAFVALLKGFYYITLGRTTAFEPAGSGFVDVADMDDVFINCRSNNPEQYASVIEPYLVSWKKQYARRIPQSVFNQFSERISKEISELQVKRRQVVHDAMKDGKALDMASLKQRMEEAKAECNGEGRLDEVRSIDAWVAQFEAKFGNTIPLDEAIKILDELENKRRATASQ